MNCPSCSSLSIKRNGHIHNGKQNYRCKDCGRQFVEFPENKVISDDSRELVEKLLLEKVSLAGICRIAEVSHVWLQDYIGKLYESQPDDLHADIPTAEEMSLYLEDRFDEYAYRITSLKKTLLRLSMSYHGMVLGHLK